MPRATVKDAQHSPATDETETTETTEGGVIDALAAAEASAEAALIEPAAAAAPLEPPTTSTADAEPPVTTPGAAAVGAATTNAHGIELLDEATRERPTEDVIDALFVPSPTGARAATRRILERVRVGDGHETTVLLLAAGTEVTVPQAENLCARLRAQLAQD